MIGRLWARLGRLAYCCARPLVRSAVRQTDRTRIIIERDGKVLVVKAWLGDGKWSLPGGGLHAGESVAAGAVRELYEETGLRFAPAAVTLLVSEPYPTADFACRLHYCRLNRPPSATSAPRPRWPEIHTLAWLPPAELTVRTAAPDTVRALSFH